MRTTGKLVALLLSLPMAAMAQTRPGVPPASIYSSGGATPPPASIYSIPTAGTHFGFGTSLGFTARPGFVPHRGFRGGHHRQQGSFPVYVPYAVYPYYDYSADDTYSQQEIENGGTFQRSQREPEPESPDAPTVFENRQQGSRYRQPPSTEQDSRYGTHAFDGREQPQNQRGETAAPEQSEQASAVTPNNLDDDSPTLLIFRDGHQQEVTNYAIMGQTLFVLSGEHSRIPVSELDIAKTAAANEKRGIDFHVPKT